MGFRRAAFLLITVASIIVLFSLPVTSLGSKKKPQEDPLLAYLIGAGEINEDMAEKIWLNCRMELMHAKETIDKQNSGHILRLLIKESLLDCLKRGDARSLIPGEERGSGSWYSVLKLAYFRPNAWKRRGLLQSLGVTPAAAPSPALSVPAPSPAPSFAAPSPAPILPNIQPPTKAPAKAPVLPFFPRDENNTSVPPTANENSTSAVQPNKQKSNSKTVIIAVLVTATATFVAAALLVLCYYKVCGGQSRRGQNDERPLLSLSMSDYSVASSHKYAVGTPVHQQKLDFQSLEQPIHNKLGANPFTDGQSFNNTKVEIPIRNTTEPPITSTDSMPFSTVTMAPSGLPPLKPPPGRTNLETPPLKAAAPPPPPSVPHPPPQPLSKAPRPLPPGPPPPPLPSGMKTGPRPPPPPPAKGAPPPPPGKGGPPPPRAPPLGLRPPRPLAPGSIQSSATSSDGGDADAPKTKLKPFFWDKVLANPDQSMVWDQIRSGSFQFNEEMIETLFGYAAVDKNRSEQKKESSSQDPSSQFVQLIDPKKAQNLSILLKALNVTTEEVCDALQEGNELPSELLQTLLKMAPTAEEELKLRLYSGEPSRLGPAERFLKVLVDIPFAFKRMESLLFMCTLQEEVAIIKESFATLEAACTELRKSRLFLKLLEAVLKTGNRMNDGTFRGGAQAFKLDTLLKLADVKGIDGKTTLLHFVVQEIIRSEGVRAARAARENLSISSIKSDDLLEDPSNDSEDHFRSIGLQVVAGLSGELENVKKAAVLDADSLTGTVAKLGHALIKARDFLNSEMKNVEEENGFNQTLKNFVQNTEVDIMSLLEEEKRIMALVKSTGDYFHGNAVKDEGLRLFVIVRDFLVILDKVCREVKAAPRKPKNLAKEDSVERPSEGRQTAVADPRQRLFPAIAERRMDSSSSDDES